MAAADDGTTSATDDMSSEVAPVASVEASEAGPPSAVCPGRGAAAASSEGKSDLLVKIEQLRDTQRALKEQKKACAKDMRNAVKRKRRLQTQASQLSDTDLLEVLHMRKAKKVEGEKIASSDPKPE